MRFLGTLFLATDLTGANGYLDVTLDESLTAVFNVAPDHSIFEGHFPGHPVVPGVCTISLVRELLESYYGHALLFKMISQCKFTGMILPESGSIEVLIKKKGINSVYAEVKQANQVVFKMKAVWERI
ncbi:MAG TPA: hypothetical protein PKE52_02010 [Bacteroidales bacterium]|jgi:3-hydroxyacyl-[acyl-carrier-protein] dehydratase|nr:hypothetical protein [Bacteroidales bacterium]